MRVLALILAVPLIEIALFVTVGGWLGLWLTLAVVLGTGVLGVALMRRLGGGVALRGPFVGALTPMAHQGLLMLAAVLLVLPGFFTDTLGLLLLVPPVRQGVIALMAAQARRRGFTVQSAGFTPQTRDDVIEGDYFAMDEATNTPKPPSKWTQD